MRTYRNHISETARQVETELLAAQKAITQLQGGDVLLYDREKGEYTIAGKLIDSNVAHSLIAANLVVATLGTLGMVTYKWAPTVAKEPVAEMNSKQSKNGVDQYGYDHNRRCYSDEAVAKARTGQYSDKR